MMYGHKNAEAWSLATHLDNDYYYEVEMVRDAYPDDLTEQARALRDELPREINGIEITLEKLEDYLAE